VKYLDKESVSLHNWLGERKRRASEESRVDCDGPEGKEMYDNVVMRCASGG